MKNINHNRIHSGLSAYRNTSELLFCRSAMLLIIVVSLLTLTSSYSSTIPEIPISRVGIISDDEKLPEEDVSEQDERERFQEGALLWQIYLDALGIQAEVIELDDLDNSIERFDMLVLPDIQRLDADAREVLLQYLQAGNSLILTGKAGNYSEGPGSSLAAELGLRYADYGDGETTSWWAVFDKPSFFSAGIPRMQHLSIEEKEPVSISTDKHGIAFWLDSNPGEAKYGETRSRTAVYADNYGSGRFLWLGFALESAGGDIYSNEAFLRVLLNALDWFSGLPAANLAPWPAPYRTAAIFSMDVEEQFANIRRVHEVGVLPAITYFILTNAAGIHREFLRKIAQSKQNEISVSVHGDNHDIFTEQSPEVQWERLKKAYEDVIEIVGKPPVGFRPPEEAYNYYTLRALVDIGYRYILANDSPDRAEPQVMKIEGKPLVQFTMLNQDDVEFIVMPDNPPVSDVVENYHRDMDGTFMLEGLYITNFHSQILATEQYIGVLPPLVEYAREAGAWIVNGAQMMEWWLKREHVKMDIVDKDDREIHLRVMNTGQETVEGIVVEIWLPDDITDVGHDSAYLEGLADGQHSYEVEGNRIRLTLPALAPGEEIEIE